MDEVRFAFLGAGMMAKAHSLALATLPIYAWPPPAMPVRQVIAGSSPERGDDFGTDPAGPLGFRFDTSGRGALSDLGSHVIDYARFLVGEIAEVAAVDRTYIHARPLLGGDGTGPVEVADAAMALVQFEGGAYG